MASKRIQGITIEIGGDTTELQKALKGVDSELRNTQANLKDVDRLLKLDPGNVTLLTQKQKNLTAAIKDTKDRLDTLKTASKEAMTTDQQDALQREIIETEDKLKSLTKEMRNFGSVGAQQVAAVGDKLQSTGKKLTEIGGKMSTRLTLPIVAGFTAAAASASDYEENLNKIEVAFGKYARDVRNFSDNAMDQFGLSKVAASEAVASFGALAKGVGLSERRAAELSKSLTGLSADLGSYFNMSNEDSAKALEGIFTGQAESLRKFGVVMTETNLEAYAQRQGLVYKEMSEAEKVMVRYNYVLEKTKDAQGDYARTSDGTANTIKTFQAAISDLGTTLGQEILPIVTPIIQKLTEMVKKIGELPEPVKKAIVIGGMVVAVAGPILSAIGSITQGIGGIMKLVPAISGGISGIGGALGGLGAAAAPFLAKGAIVVGIIAAVAAITVLVVKNWDKIKEACAKMGRAIADTWRNMVNGIKTGFNNAKDWVINGWNTLKNNVVNTVTNIKNSVVQTFENIKTSIAQKIESVKNGIVDKFTAAKEGVVNIWKKIVDALKKPVNGIIGLINGVIGGLEAAINWIINGLNRIQVTIPSWVPGIGGRTFGVNLGNVSFGRLNYLANGGTLKEGQHAIVGENAPEYLRVVNGEAIVTPIQNTTRNDTNNVTINVYARPGQNVRDLAQEVKSVLIREQQQRSAAYA